MYMCAMPVTWMSPDITPSRSQLHKSWEASGKTKDKEPKSILPDQEDNFEAGKFTTRPS